MLGIGLWEFALLAFLLVVVLVIVTAIVVARSSNTRR